MDILFPVSEQEVESETVEKINQDSENIIDQADTSNDMISSPLDDANVKYVHLIKLESDKKIIDNCQA